MHSCKKSMETIFEHQFFRTSNPFFCTNAEKLILRTSVEKLILRTSVKKLILCTNVKEKIRKNRTREFSSQKKESEFFCRDAEKLISRTHVENMKTVLRSSPGNFWNTHSLFFCRNAKNFMHSCKKIMETIFEHSSISSLQQVIGFSARMQKS